MKRTLPALLLLLLAFPAAAEIHIREYRLFSASTDSTEQASPWIEVGGAKQVIIRTWSNKAAFHASTDADSTFTDSIAVFKVVFSDSLTTTSPRAAQDSTVITTATVANIDTTTKMVGVFHPPLQEALRGPANGAGIVTYVMPIVPSTVVGGPLVGNGGVIASQYMRVLITPHRRMTVTGGQSTAGKRVNGLKLLRMKALVISEEQ